MEKKGYNQGDMSPHVEDFHAKDSEFAGEQFSKTLQYMDRKRAFLSKEASQLKKQNYHGRYD